MVRVVSTSGLSSDERYGSSRNGIYGWAENPVDLEMLEEKERAAKREKNRQDCLKFRQKAAKRGWKSHVRKKKGDK